MPRRGNISQREVLPDPIYNNQIVTKLINKVMYDGKKGVAQSIVYDAFKIVSDKTSKDALDAFNEALNNVGGAVKKKEETHKMAEANRAFAHYRW